MTDAYNRRCAVTEAKVLPVLEAAHIKPYSAGGEHSPDNGLLLRRDLHTLFDVGYLTVTPERRVEISRYVKEDWDNGEEYYKLHGTKIRPPAKTYPEPSTELLRWHNDTVFRG